MSARRHAFVTGATGFLGSHLVARLLKDGYHITTLARSSKRGSATTRVHEVLRDVGITDLSELTVVEGDISLPNLGLDEDRLRGIAARTDEVWHSAASLSFENEDRDEIFRMNVTGTAHVLDFVKRTPSRRLQHVSTAYVAGNRQDLALETDIDVGQTFKNAYEESKCRAELLIADEQQKGLFSATVYRPSIVIGDSKTGRVTHFHGVYAFIRALWSALDRLRRRAHTTDADAGPVTFPLRVVGVAEQTLNFVPIDYVVDGMVEISQRLDSIGRTYHLTNPTPTPNRLWLPNICRLLNVEGIQFVDKSAFAETPVTKREALFQKHLAFYYQYLQGEPRFDCRQTLAALENTGISCPPVTVEFMERMVGWYVGYLKNTAKTG